MCFLVVGEPFVSSLSTAVFQILPRIWNWKMKEHFKWFSVNLFLYSFTTKCFNQKSSGSEKAIEWTNEFKQVTREKCRRFIPRPIVSPLKCIIISSLYLSTILWIFRLFVLFVQTQLRAHCATFAFRLFFFQLFFLCFSRLPLFSQQRVFHSVCCVVAQRVKTHFFKAPT